MDIWKPIPNFIGSYEASNHGLIKSLDRIGYNPRYGNQRLRGQLLKASLGEEGYYHLDLRKDGIRSNLQVHRLVAITFVDNPHGYDFVNHKDKNKTNNNDWNLEWTTHRENLSHSFLGLGTSKYVGVSWNKANRKWVTFIRLNKISTYIGSFETELAAAKAYNNALAENGLINKYSTITP